jgi:hypothetical protein
MASAEKEYVKLPGQGLRRPKSWVAGHYTRCTLWLAKDHLLSVDSMGGYTEEYKRFYFRDIQAITIRRTVTWAVWNGVNALFAALFLFFALSVNDPVGFGFLIGFASLFGLFLLVNALRGATCQCHLRTAVQTEELPSLCRARVARKVLARLRPLIEAAQGTLSPEEVEQKVLASAQAALNAPARPAPRARAGGPPAVVTHYAGQAHAVAFWLCLADIPGTMLGVLTGNRWANLLGMLLFLAAFIAAIWAVVRQSGTDIPRFLQRLTWSIIVVAVVYFFISSMVGQVMLVMNPEDINPLTGIEPDYTNPVFFGLAVVSTSVNAVIGSLGLYRLSQFRNAAGEPPSPAAP